MKTLSNTLQKEIEEIAEKLNLKIESLQDFKDKVFWNYISLSQSLSEEFIEKFKDKVNWDWISHFQFLSEKFIEKFKDKVDIEVQKRNHKEKTIEQKTKEVKEYAKKHKLKFDGKFLYAFRDHDKWGRGSFNKAISYKKGKYYKDWHCNMNEKEENSFGLGIWPKGNTKVKVKVEDWGCEVSRNDGKGRVWGFEIV